MGDLEGRIRWGARNVLRLESTTVTLAGEDGPVPGVTVTVDETDLGELADGVCLAVPDELAQTGSTRLFTCGCGDPGCYQVSVTVEVRDEVVVWTDVPGAPYVFDRDAYERALRTTGIGE